MKDEIQFYEINFRATIGQFFLNTPKFSLPLTAIWSRGIRSEKTSAVEMSGGKANFNQTLTLSLNMQFGKKDKVFRQKKTRFIFKMHSPIGQKLAGLVSFEVAQMLNNNTPSISNYFPLKKCPFKDSKVFLSITAQLIHKYQFSINIPYPTVLPPIQPQRLPTSFKIKEQQEEKQEQTNNSEMKEKSIENLEARIKQLAKQKERLAKELQKERSKNAVSEAGILKQQLIKSKSIRQRQQSEIINLRSEKIEHCRELQKMKIKMEEIFQHLFSNQTSLH